MIVYEEEPCMEGSRLIGNLCLKQNTGAEVVLFPSYLLKMLGNTQSIPCAFEFI